MKRNASYGVIAIILVLLGGIGLFVGYKGYKKYKRAQNQEFRYEGTMPFQITSATSAENLKKEVLADESLNKVIEKHQLVEKWGLADAAAAKERLQGKFGLRVDGTQIKVTYQDRDKVLAQEILASIVEEFVKKVRAVKGAPRTPDTPDIR